MGFRRPLAFFVLGAAAVSFGLAMAAPTAKPAAAASAATASGAKPAATTSAAAPASSTAKPAASATKSAQDKFAALQAVPTKPGDPKVGKTKAAACGACHGKTGNSTSPQYPKLAGQRARYIVTELMRFKSGVRKNAIMNGMAAPLSPQDMWDIAAYFSSQKLVPGVADPKLVKQGRKIYHQGDAASGVPACAACHGPAGLGNPGWPTPRLAGQHAQYIQKVLEAWHAGGSWGSDPHAKIMPSIARRLTKPEIVAVSSYIEGLHAAPPPKKPSGNNPID